MLLLDAIAAAAAVGGAVDECDEDSGETDGEMHWTAAEQAELADATDCRMNCTPQMRMRMMMMMMKYKAVDVDVDVNEDEDEQSVEGSTATE